MQPGAVEGGQLTVQDADRPQCAVHESDLTVELAAVADQGPRRVAGRQVQASRYRRPSQPYPGRAARFGLGRAEQQRGDDLRPDN